jgi:non-ribosomal peptide synthetase component F
MIALASGDGEVVLGTTTDGRSRRFAATVGMLANTLIIKSAIDTSASFAAVLGEVSLNLMDALDHQELPYSRVIAELSGSGRGLGEDLIRTMFAGGAHGGLTVREERDAGVPAYRVEGPFEVMTLCYVEGSMVALDWEFALRSYSRETAAGYRDAYQTILAAVLRDPEAPIDSLGLTDMLTRLVPDASPTAVAVSPGAGASNGADAGTSNGGPAGHTSLSPVEAAVAAIWAEFLQVPVESPLDDFFKLGGQSMVASQVVAVVRRKVAPATMRILFDHPQLRDFCAQLDAGE